MPKLRRYVIARSKQLMSTYKGTGDYEARFRHMAAEQYEAVGDYNTAIAYFREQTRIDKHSGMAHYIWRGHYGRARVRERQGHHTMAAEDYKQAFKKSGSSGWAGYECVRALARLYYDPGKLNKPDTAEDFIKKALERAGNDKNLRERIEKLRDLKKK